MDTTIHFRNIEELVKALERERVLLKEMFAKRKLLSLRTDMALELVDYKRERIQYLINRGVIHETGNFLELEAIYLQFFEEVLDVNEEISVASVRECIETLQEQMGLYLKASTEADRLRFLSSVRQLLRKTGLRTLKNVIDLKRNVETAYKQEPNYAIKRQKLQNLDKKSIGIKTLIKESEKLLNEEALFFSQTASPDMLRTVADVRNDFVEAYRNLLEIDRQIIRYINLIDEQNKLFDKIRKVKYLKDQLTWTEETNIMQVLGEMNPIWMENRPYNKIRLSLDYLRSSEEMAELLRKIAAKSGIKQQARIEADNLSPEDMEEHRSAEPLVNPNEVWRAFEASSHDLFNFILNYDYKQERTLSDHVTLFCQLAVLHPEECKFTGSYQTYNQIEYPLIYAK